MKRVLIIEDEQAISWTLAKALDRAGFQTDVAASAEAGLAFAPSAKPDAVLLDVRLPGIDGIQALERLQTLAPGVPVVVMTAHGNLSTAVKALAGGAFDYLAKPFDLSQAIDAVRRAVQARSLPEAPPSRADDDEELLGSSPAMQAVFKRIALVAPHDTSVLITGESGTGKELTARALHQNSPRRHRPFVAVHVAALNPNLVESELFGHVKGAFTGAETTKPGLLVSADGGTVFLDELADIPLPVQAKLLRVLERQEVFPVGGNVAVRINVRILAATHQDLEKAVKSGAFRHDLYFRLCVFDIRLPSLRDRLDDIPALVERFLRNGPPRPPLSDETLTYLRRRPWYGNIRELKNATEHAAIVSRGGALLPTHFPPDVSLSESHSTEERLTEAVRDWTRRRIAGIEPTDLYDALLAIVEPPLCDEVLHRLDGNRLAAARWLGLARATLRKMLNKYRPTEADEEEPRTS